MSYKEFRPDIWSTEIMRNLERDFVGATDCYRKYEGEIKQAGDTVRVMGVLPPTITTTSDGKPIILSDPEDVPNSDVAMPIMQQSTFHFIVNNIDKAQGIKGIMDAQMAEATEALSDEIDKYILGFANDNQAILSDATPVAITADNVMNFIDAAKTKLKKNDVKASTVITMTVDPLFYQVIREAYTKVDTDNSEQLKNGQVGKYNNIIIRESNNCWNDGSGNYKMMMRTQRAVAFANQLQEIKAYSPEKRFGDAVKGYSLYDAKIVRPKEMIVLNAALSA